MNNLTNISIKQEISDRTIAETSERPIEVNEDEESSDGENSVIILESDTEPEDGGADDEEAADEEDSDEDDEDEDEEESEEDSDSSVDSESVNSVWSTVDEAVGGDNITTEAAEVSIVKKFEKAMYLIADKNVEKGQRLLEKLLDDPLISTYRMEQLDYETLEEPPRLARMLQVFIALHKNLAKLDSDNQVDHLCQVLAYEPNNTAIWFDVALKSVDNGDLDFAKYAFKKCESLKESLEAHATVLYLTCDYAACLNVMKTYKEETDSLNDKMKYLKYKIRTTSQYYKQLSDRIFEEDEVYADINALDSRKIIVFDERIEELRRRTEGKRLEIADDMENEQEKLSVIPITISAEQDLATVCTIFCDLFDRIHNYSHSRHQLIEIVEWESRKDYLEVVETMEKILDIVECVEEMTAKVEEDKKRKKKMTKTQKKEYKANWRKRLFVERNLEDVESEQNTTADEDDEETSQDENQGTSGVPDNELASSFGLACGEINPIKSGRRIREKTPPPTLPQEFIDSDSVLALLAEKFSTGTHTIIELIEGTLFLLTEHTPSGGALPAAMRELMREMYNRLALLCPMHLQNYDELNVAVMETDCLKATEVCIKKYISCFHRSEEENEAEEQLGVADTRSLVLRFMWKYANSRLKEEIKLEYLYSLDEFMRVEEVVATTSGSFATWDVELAIEELEKKKRIESVKHLWKSRNYRDLVNIIENDIEFGAITNEETLEMLTYWLQSLEKLKMTQQFASLATRALHFYLFGEFALESPTKLENLTESLLMKLQRVDFKKVDITTSSTIGYLVCAAMKQYKKLEKEWRNWKILFDVIKAIRGMTAEDYINTLDKNLDPHAMPLLELDLLVKAHEVLGEYHVCAQRNYEFLFFFIDRFREIVDDIPVLELCYSKENGWLWNNLNDELSQILFCMYGKYAKRRKTGEDHENGGCCSTTAETARRVLAVILVQPLPLYDEKEKLLHDVTDLLHSKFPFMLTVAPERKKKLDEFTSILRAANSREDINEGLNKFRDDVDDYTQSLVWYAMALNAYRTSNHKDAAKYSELYLLTEESVHDDRLRGSIWGVLAHENVHNLFQLDLHEIYEQWKWRIMPFRMAVDAQEHEPVPHFELAAIIYQLATSLARFYRSLDRADPRKKDLCDVAKLRTEAREQFDRSLELTKLGEDGSQPEHQWLCYFFIGKLEAKDGKWDIVKVVESFYEAACGCELAGFYYPQRVQTKKQQNFEPLEVHYQAHAAVFKYLMNNEKPPIEVLRKLHVLLKVLSNGHKVVKPSNSLFRVSPDVYTVVDSLVFETVRKERKEENSDEDCLELINSLKELCFKAFTLVTERFPHIKSYYRLAQIARQKGALEMASEHIFRNVFKRKKKDDAIFENVVEISCNDINRNGSFNFHVERCLKLGVQVAQRLLDLHNIVAVLLAMINVIVKDDEDHVSKEVWKTIVTASLTAMENIAETRNHLRSTPSPAFGEPVKKAKTTHVTAHTLRVELWKLWSAITKCSSSDELIQMMKTKTQELIKTHFHSVEELRARMTASKDDVAVKKKYMTQKRRLEAADMTQMAKRVAEQSAAFVSIAPPVLTPQKPTTASVSLAPSSSGPYLPLSDSDDEIQCIEPPAKKAVPPVVQKQPVALKPVTPKSVPPKPVTVRQVVSVGTKPAILKPAAAKPSTSAPKPAAANPAQVQQLAAVIAGTGAGNNTSATNPALSNISQMIAAAALSNDENSRRVAAQALQTLQAMQVQNAVQTAIQSAQAQAAAAHTARIAAAAATRAPTIARPTAVRPPAQNTVGRPPNRPNPVASRLSLTSSQQNQQQPPRLSLPPTRPQVPTAQVPAARFSNIVNRANSAVPVRPVATKPSSASTSGAALVRPSPVRPTAQLPQQRNPPNIARPAPTRPANSSRQEPASTQPTGVVRANIVQFLQTITDPVERARMVQVLLGNN